MVQRIPKTVERKLADLDDHLSLLDEGVRRLQAGESAYLKAISAELRVLVCYSERGLARKERRVLEDGLTGGCLGNSSIVSVHSSKADSYH